MCTCAIDVPVPICIVILSVGYHYIIMFAATHVKCFVLVFHQTVMPCAVFPTLLLYKSFSWLPATTVFMNDYRSVIICHCQL